MNVRKSIILWSFVLIILSLNVDVDGAKTARRGGTNKKAPNYDHVQLSYGSHGHKNTHHQPVPQHQYHQQQHQPQAHQSHHPPTPQQHLPQQHSPSAPTLPTNNNHNNQPIGWNVHHTDTVNQPKTVSNTQSALPYPQNPPPYQQNAGFNAPAAGPPPPYSPSQNPTFNAHPAAGSPPAYSPNPNPAFGPPAGQPPAYQPAPSYPGRLESQCICRNVGNMTR